MAFVGKAFMIMWHDIAEAADAEYHRWHTHEHMLERVALPGFLRARRGVNRGLSRQRYLTIYEGESLESFVSDSYARSLNFPTDWTTRMAPYFRNFLRVSCLLEQSSGYGVGGAIATYRCRWSRETPQESLSALYEEIGVGILDCSEVVAVHVGVARSEYSAIETRETELRPQMNESEFDVVFIVEGTGLSELMTVDSKVNSTLVAAGLTDITSQAYDMAFLLSSGEADFKL